MEDTQACFHVSVLPIYVTAISSPPHPSSGGCVAVNTFSVAKSIRQHINSQRPTQYKELPALILQLLWQQFSIDAVEVLVSVCLLSIKRLCNVVRCYYILLYHQRAVKAQVQMVKCIKMSHVF